MPPLPCRTRSVRLTEEQESALDYLLQFPSPSPTLGGYAGTGKTVVASELHKRLPDFAVCAFTGKAANVLRKKGVEATTIHSRIYRPHERQWRDALGRIRTELVWERRPRHELECDGFIVDEASMVSEEIHEALLTYDRPIIYIGDHGQLEPVSASKGFNLMADPDVTLETVHRNAGEIAHFGSFIRQGNRPVEWQDHPQCTGEKVVFLSLEELAGSGEQEPDQMICAYNATRVGLNKTARECLGFPADRPVVGDRVMCLQNDKALGIFNGMQGEIKALVADEMVFTSDGRDYRVRYVPESFNQEQRSQERDRWGRIPFDYCYAVTAHKAQGDEWDRVMVLEQRCRHWDHKRWAYTAATRARQRLIWVPG